MSFPISSCNDQIANCGENEMSINDRCVPFTYTTSYDNSYPKYSIDDEDYAYPVIGQQNSFSSPYECIQSCNSVDECGAARYDYNTGNCTLLNTTPDPSNYNLLSQEESTFPRIDRSNDDPNACFGLFSRVKGSGPQNCTSPNPDENCENISLIVKPDQIINVDMHKSKPASQIQRIQSKWEGAPCRAQAAQGNISPSETDILDGMETFCKDNPSLKVCKEFCANNAYADYCATKKSTIYMLVFIGVFFLLIIIFIILKKKNKIKLSYAIGILGIIFFGLAVWEIYKYIKTGGSYDGNTPDYPPVDTPSVKKCIDNSFKCVNRTAPKGNRCVPTDPGESGTTRTMCEATCCPNGFIGSQKDGKCYPAYPTGRILWNVGESCTNRELECPPGYNPTAKQPYNMTWPNCSPPANMKAYKGDMICTVDIPPIQCINKTYYAKPPTWTECDKDECTVPNIYTSAFHPGSPGYEHMNQAYCKNPF